MLPKQTAPFGKGKNKQSSQSIEVFEANCPTSVCICSNPAQQWQRLTILALLPKANPTFGLLIIGPLSFGDAAKTNIDNRHITRLGGAII